MKQKICGFFSICHNIKIGCANNCDLYKESKKKNKKIHRGYFKWAYYTGNWNIKNYRTILKYLHLKT